MINTSNQSTPPTALNPAKVLFIGSLLLAALALPFLSPVQSRADNGDNDNSARGSDPNALLGTWALTVSLDPSSVPAGTPLSFTELDTFGAGGGFISSNNGPGAGDPAGQGNWVRTGDRQYALTQIRLAGDGKINKIRSSVTLSKSGDAFTEIDQADIILPNGTVLPFHPKATSQGTRIAIEPLD